MVAFLLVLSPCNHADSGDTGSSSQNVWGGSGLCTLSPEGGWEGCGLKGALGGTIAYLVNRG